jgi:hypothetical protein
MHPTDHHYLFSIAEEMQFPDARCAQGKSIYMYGKSASSGVVAMNRANEEIHQRMAVDILNAALILPRMEGNRYEKSRVQQEGKHLLPLTPKGMDLMEEEAFKPINPAMYKFHLAEMENHHAATVSKKSASKREYTVIIPRDDKIGSGFGMCTCGYPKKEGIPCKHMVALVKLGAINRLK